MSRKKTKKIPVRRKDFTTKYTKYTKGTEDKGNKG
jgi:hypothetical protein